MTHTAGPWEVELRDHYAGDGSSRLVVFASGHPRHRIATVSLMGAPDGDMRLCEFNARLIAAAPDLLALCATAFSALKSYQYGNSSTELAEEVASELEVLINKIRR